MAVHAELPFDAVEPAFVLARHLPAAGNSGLIDAIVKIIPDGRGEFGLVARLFQDFRVRRVHTLKGSIERMGRYSIVGGYRPELRNPRTEARIRQGGSRTREKDE